MSTTPVIPSKPATATPALPEGNSIFDECWTLRYRIGMTFGDKGFRFKGNLKEATARARTHCEAMGYRFIFVRPLINNIDQDEQKIVRGERPSLTS